MPENQIEPWLIYRGGDQPSAELALVNEHLDVLGRGIGPTYFSEEGIRLDPPELILRDPLDTKLARLLGRSFPMMSQMPDGETSVRPIRIGDLYGEWITAEGADPRRLMLYLHGGGYALGDVDSYRCFIARLSKASGCRVLAVDYRLAPEHPFPAALNDATAAYNVLCGELPANKKTTRAYIVGDSAGGGLALATTLKVMRDENRLPDAVIAMSPATDLTQSGSTLTPPEVIGGGKQFSLYFGTEDPKNPLVSPLYAELAGFPPVLLQAGETEGYLDDSIRFARKAHGAGVDVTLEIWRHMPHVHQVMAPALPEATEAIRAMGQFLHLH